MMPQIAAMAGRRVIPGRTMRQPSAKVKGVVKGQTCHALSGLPAELTPGYGGPP
jgi:hypothetical protein